MIATACAICDTSGSERETYASTVELGAADFARFSARRVPDRIHYRIVRCRNCGLIRSDPVLPDVELARLYRGSTMTYAEEAAFAGDAYARYLQRYLPLAPGRRRLLEIGCGHGFFLERALNLGFGEVCGVEPSAAAVALAPPAIRPHIRNELFREGLWPDAYFDVVCAFQVFDHLAHPNEVLRACRRVLRPGGLALFINHDAGAWTHRVLGERSPIVDIEHTYLYDRATMTRIFQKNGFQVAHVFGVRNSYPVSYWCRIAPLPSSLRQCLLDGLKLFRISNFRISWNAGNLGVVARSREGS